MTDQPTPILSTSSPRPRWRPQMSLAMMIALVTIVALCFAFYVQSRRSAEKIAKADAEVARLEAQIKQLKKDFSILEVGNSNLIHLTQLPTFEPGSTRFRVYFPRKKKFVVKYMTESIPESEFPSSIFNGVNEISVERFPKDSGTDEIGFHYKDGKIVLSLKVGNSTQFVEREIDNALRKNSNGDGGAWDGYFSHDRSIRIQRPNKPLEIVRIRQFPDLHPFPPGQAPLDNTKTVPPISPTELAPWGLLLWIEEVPNVKPADQDDEPAKM